MSFVQKVPLIKVEHRESGKPVLIRESDYDARIHKPVAGVTVSPPVQNVAKVDEQGNIDAGTGEKFDPKTGLPVGEGEATDGQVTGQMTLDLSKMTVPQMKEFAKQNGIDLAGAQSKAEVTRILDAWKETNQVDQAS